MYIVLVVCIIACFLSLPYIYLDVSSQSQSIVRSTLENTLLQTSVSGRVQQNYLKNNVVFAEGDTLLVIERNLLDTSKDLNDSIIQSTKNYLGDITKLLAKDFKSLETTRGKKEYNAYVASNRELYAAYNYAKKQHDRQKLLLDKKVIAQAVYDQYLFDLEKAQAARNSFKSQQKADWEIKKQELEERLQKLEGDKEQLAIQSQDYIITAPISGTVINYQGLTKESQILQGQQIAVLSPYSDLIIESSVNPSDIGLIKIGQPVRYEFDAFNYNQWGFLEGKVVDIDKNISITDSGAFFKVRCSLPNTALSLKNGYKANVSQGMTLTTRYFIARRSLYDLLFDKVDDWFNPKIIS